jgi:predicted MFS family arabinose efflux permease
MLKAYRRVLATPGSVAFCLAGTVARLPASMAGLGLVLLVELRTGSYGTAGAVSAAYVVTSGVAGPAIARLADRLGQAPVLRGASLLFAVGILAFLVALETDAPAWTYYAFAALAGTGAPQAGAMVRARWTHALRGRPGLDTAFALEAVLDEVVFIVGPVLVTVLTLQVHETAGLAVPVLAALGGSWALAAQQATAPPPAPHVPGTARVPIGWALLGPMVVAAAGIGVMFGAVEVVVVAFTDEAGTPGAAGVVLAVFSGGSLLAGLLVGAFFNATDPLRRLRVTTVLLAALVVPAWLSPDVVTLSAAMLLLGLMVSPTLIAAVSLVERHVAPTRLTEGITWTMTGMAAGTALGAAVSGQVVDAHPAATGFLVPLAAGAVTAALAWATREPPVRTPA